MQTARQASVSYLCGFIDNQQVSVRYPVTDHTVTLRPDEKHGFGLFDQALIEVDSFLDKILRRGGNPATTSPNKRQEQCAALFNRTYLQRFHGRKETLP